MQRQHLNESTFFMVVLMVGVAVIMVLLFADPASTPTNVVVPSTTSTSTTSTTSVPDPVVPLTVSPAVPAALNSASYAVDETLATDEPATTEPDQEITTTTLAPCVDETAGTTGVSRCRPTSNFPDEYPNWPRCYDGAQPPDWDTGRQPYDGIDWRTGQPFPVCVHDPVDP